jgi:hypothetical protein
VNVAGIRNCWPPDEIRTSSLLGEGDDETLALGLTEELTLLETDDEGESEMELETLEDAESEIELETLTDGESEMLVLGLTELDTETEMLLLTLSLGDELTLLLMLELTLSLTLTEGDELSDDEPIAATNTGPTIGAYRSVRACVRNGTPHAPAVCVSSALVDDETDELIDELTDELALELIDDDGDELADEAISSNATNSIMGALFVQPVEVQVSAVRVATRVCTWVVMAAASF